MGEGRDEPRKEEMNKEVVQPRGGSPEPRERERSGAVLVVAAGNRPAEGLHVL